MGPSGHLTTERFRRQSGCEQWVGSQATTHGAQILPVWGERGSVSLKGEGEKPRALGPALSQSPAASPALCRWRPGGTLRAFTGRLSRVSNFNEEIFHLPSCFQETSLEGIFTSH